MPLYEYYSPETGEEKETFHGINEEPEVLDSQGNLMKRKISLSSFIIKTGGTRNRTMQARYGHKKSMSEKTPTESAAEKASNSEAQAKHEKLSKKDPYYAFR